MTNNQAQIKAFTDKSKCFDIFMKTKVNNYRMYPIKHQLDFQKYINDTKKSSKLLQKIQVVKGIAFKSFSGYGNLTFIRITLKEIQL